MAALPYDVFALLRITHPTETYLGDAAVNGYDNAANQFYFDHPSDAKFENLTRVRRTRVAL
jgi:hypothetical protein